MPVAVGEESVGGVSLSEIENEGFEFAHEIKWLGVCPIGSHLNTTAAELMRVAVKKRHGDITHTSEIPDEHFRTAIRNGRHLYMQHIVECESLREECLCRFGGGVFSTRFLKIPLTLLVQYSTSA